MASSDRELVGLRDNRDSGTDAGERQAVAEQSRAEVERAAVTLELQRLAQPIHAALLARLRLLLVAGMSLAAADIGRAMSGTTAGNAVAASR